MKIIKQMESRSWFITSKSEGLGNKKTKLILPAYQYFPGEDLNFKNKKSGFNYKLIL